MTEQVLCDPSRDPTREGVVRAMAKIAAILPPTPLLPLEVDGHTVWCKAEMVQPIGAFKIRGAWNRLSDLSEEERARGVVGLSSGNHAQGVAWAARRLGISAAIVMPKDAPAAKLAATRALGAEVVLYDRYTESRDAIAAAMVAESGATLVHAYDDPWIVEGQGTLALEAAAQLAAREDGAQFDHIIACCGGGGLASGCALALPDARLTIVEPEGWDDAARSLASGEVVTLDLKSAPPTKCDALQTPFLGRHTFPILRGRGAEAVQVSEAEVAAAMRVAFEQLHLVVEPGGAVALAAVLAGKVELGAYPLVTLSGGNVDPATYAALIAGI